MANSKGMFTAKGHVAKIIRFDEATVLIPASSTEVYRLFKALGARFEQLNATGDFPEKQEYQNMLDNLTTAMWMLS